MITFTDINKSNWEECIALSVLPEQKSFVASNVLSLAQSKIFPGMIPLGFCVDGKQIGFAMYSNEIPGSVEPKSAEPGSKAPAVSWIIRFMIDSKHQKMGYGREALAKLIELLRGKYPQSVIILSVEPDNEVAIKLYKSFGFRPTGEVEEGELVFELKS